MSHPGQGVAMTLALEVNQLLWLACFYLLLDWLYLDLWHAFPVVWFWLCSVTAFRFMQSCIMCHQDLVWISQEMNSCMKSSSARPKDCYRGYSLYSGGVAMFENAESCFLNPSRSLTQMNPDISMLECKSLLTRTRHVAYFHCSSIQLVEPASHYL